jgi:hypothetical protein
MTTPRTGQPEGRPKGSLRDHPYRFALAFSDAIQESLGITAQKSYLLAAAVFLSDGAEPRSPSDPSLSRKLRTALEKFGGNVVSYELPASGNKESKSIKERIQSIDTLSKMANRIAIGDDLDYRAQLALLFKLILFTKSGSEMRSAIIRVLSIQMGEDTEALKLIKWLQ